MADCANTHNPGCLKCPTNIRWYNVHGSKDDGSWEHITDMLITLKTVSREYTLFNAKRKAGMSWGVTTKASNGKECTSIVGQQPAVELFYYYLADWKNIEPYTCNFKEQREVIENEVLFLDLRHDIVVRKETRYVYDKDVDSGDSTLWNNYGSVVRTHKIVPGDIDGREYITLYINNDSIDRKEMSFVSENPYTFAVPAYGGLPQANTTTNIDGKEVDDIYYIWTEQKDEDGGYDLYYPEWVRGIAPIAEQFDMANRDRHRALSGIVPYDREPVGSVTTSGTSYNTIESPTKIMGSWAVSPQLSDLKTNYRAYCTLLLDNNSFKLKLDPEAPNVTTLMGDPDKCIYPISPL